MVKASELSWDDVVRVGPGTLGGNYLRCFWWPVALSEEVRDVPVPVKVLGEELVLFRDLSGHLALLGAHCSHRRASLEYGRIEEQGIRCAYHGWYYDRQGRILDRPAEPIKTAPGIRQNWYPVRELGGFVFAHMGPDKESPPPLPRYDVLVQDGYRVAERGDAESGKAYKCNWLQGVENTTDTTHLAYLHGIFESCPIFKAVEGEFGVKIYILEHGSNPNTVRVRKRCTVLPTINRKSREPRAKNPDRLRAQVQQAIWIVPIDDTRCEEMRLTVYSEPPKDKRYHGIYQDRARQTERKPYDRRLFGDITGIVPLEDKAMVESQGEIVDRTLEHPGYGDRAILLLRKMIRDGIADVAQGRKPKGVLQEELPMIDLDIGFEEFEIDKAPEVIRDLLPELEAQVAKAG
ncbi:MAG: Rieske 2Fe-2S domain-containing protein [Deltaproteobacteria bacterium]|nr:MAG: Rieske 2Fe-2S domain-containing protein [Deltaproteobacteria bacterium]